MKEIMENISLRTASTTLVAVIGATFSVGAAEAADPASFQLGVSTQYIGKGLGKSSDEPSLSGSVELSHSGFYVNVFAASAELAQGADAELVTTGGYRTTVAGYGLDLAVINRDLPGTRPGVDANFTEYQADISRKISSVSTRFRINYTADGFAATEEAWWLELQCGAALDASTKATVAVADRLAHGGVEYVAWNAGVRRKLPHDLALDLRWYDTDGHRFGPAYDGRLVGALTYSF